MNKVDKGTPYHHGPSLCVTCRHAMILAGSALADERTFCDAAPRGHDRIVFKVTACTKYDDKARPSFNQMQQIAWELRTDKKGHRIGFMSPIDSTRMRAKLADLPYLNTDDD